MLGAVCLVLAGCGAGEQVTPSALAKARRNWSKAKIHDYNLEWTSSGQRTSHYRVYVRDGKVKRIDSVLPGGHEKVMHPAEPDMYSVDGLLQVIEEELAQVKGPSPFGQAHGAGAVLRFTPDPALGYPKSYSRDVPGTPQGLAIDVVRLDVNPPSAIPPPVP
ncbi:MAG TPA: DUF6174 domain-containing protein [Isosphaeraceae bacterium]|jgi:hypothetical protein|nr:DUF6174 domain-containing protein [Isosphaeraceae bacterium]